MKNKLFIAVLLHVLFVTMLTGCSNLTLRPQSVIINIKQITQTPGFNEQMNESIELLKQQHSENMKILAAELQKIIADEKAGIGTNPSEEDEKRIQALQKDMQKQFYQKRKAAQTKLGEEISEIRQSFVRDIMSIAQVVAYERGASIILGANTGGIVWSDASLNITDEVMRRMQDGKTTGSESSEQN